MVALLSCRKYPDYMPSTDSGRWVVSTIAGDGAAIFGDGPALQSHFHAPLDVEVSDNGTVYVADALNHRIRKIANGQVTTVAGSSVSDTIGGTVASARFRLPSYLSFDPHGHLLVLDTDDPRVRRIKTDGTVDVIAGSGMDGFADGPASSAQFEDETLGVVTDKVGNIYVVDSKNFRIRKIDIYGQVTTIAGDGHSGYVNGDGKVAEFETPSGITIDPEGNLLVGDGGRIRKISPRGVVSTYSGMDIRAQRDGPLAEARFIEVRDLATDHHGTIYLTDNNAIRKISVDGYVSTIAGDQGGYADGDAGQAKFLGPVGLAVDRNGSIYVADDHNNRIRKITWQ